MLSNALKGGSSKQNALLGSTMAGTYFPNSPLLGCYPTTQRVTPSALPWAGTYFQNSALPGHYLKRKGVGWRARL